MSQVLQSVFWATWTSLGGEAIPKRNCFYSVHSSGLCTRTFGGIFYLLSFLEPSIHSGPLGIPTVTKALCRIQ